MVKYPNVYGIDMPSAKELIAHDRSVEELSDLIGSDWLLFQDIDALEESVQRGNPDIKQFDASVFNNVYITGDITKDYLDELEDARNDHAKNNEMLNTNSNQNDNEDDRDNDEESALLDMHTSR